MFTAWDHVRTLSPEAVRTGRVPGVGEPLPLAALEVTKRRGCSLLPRVPTPGGARPSSVPLELLMEGRGFFPCRALARRPRAGGGAGAAGWATLPRRHRRSRSCRLAVVGAPHSVVLPCPSRPLLLTLLLHTADDQQCDSDALQSTEF